MELQRLSCGMELKLAPGPTDEMSFEGYGAVFGNVDSYGDVIAPGAFADTLAGAKQSNQWPAMLMQHGGFLGGAEDMTPVGIWTDLVEDGTGLRATGRLADTPRGREAYTLLKMQPRPALTGLSIGYTPKEWSPRTKPEEPRRTLKKVELWEVSLVTFPANPKARISNVKSCLTERDAEEALREAGFSRTEAKALVRKGFTAIGGQREADDDDGIEELRGLLARLRA